MVAIHVLASAEADIAQGMLWYNHCRPGLGADFLLCVEEAMDRIRSHPEAYAVIHRNIRRALMRRFPFGIFYRIDEDGITVIAVPDFHRNPRHWQK